MEAAGGATPPSLLIVATIAPTIRGFLLPYALHFRQRGWRVEAAAYGASDDPTVREAFDAVHELDLSRSIRDLGGMVTTYRQVAKTLERGFAIVHVHTPIASFLTRLAVRRMPRERRPRIVYTAHGFHFHSGGHPLTNALYIAAEKVAGRWTDRLVVINEADQAAARHYRLVPSPHLVLMPGIGVDTERFSPASVSSEDISAVRAWLGVGPETPLLVVVAELSRRKRPVDVVQALARMRSSEAHIVMLGDGPERATVEAAIASEGVSDRVHVMGIVPDVRPTVAASIALILPSSREGLPRSIMEALALEVPVITTDARGNVDLVEPDAGIVVPIGDVTALAAAMDRLVSEPEVARSMGRAGRARMVKGYDITILLGLHERLYAELLSD